MSAPDRLFSTQAVAPDRTDVLRAQFRLCSTLLMPSVPIGSRRERARATTRSQLAAGLWGTLSGWSEQPERTRRHCLRENRDHAGPSRPALPHHPLLFRFQEPRMTGRVQFGSHWHHLDPARQGSCQKSLDVNAAALLRHIPRGCDRA